MLLLIKKNLNWASPVLLSFTDRSQARGVTRILLLGGLKMEIFEALF